MNASLPTIAAVAAVWVAPLKLDAVYMRFELAIRQSPSAPHAEPQLYSTRAMYMSVSSRVSFLEFLTRTAEVRSFSICGRWPLGIPTLCLKGCSFGWCVLSPGALPVFRPCTYVASRGWPGRAEEGRERYGIRVSLTMFASYLRKSSFANCSMPGYEHL